MLEIARQPVVAQPPWRAIGCCSLLIGALAAGLILAATRPKPPPLFGPAGNGLVVMSRDGDIFTVDPRRACTDRDRDRPRDRQRPDLVTGRDETPLPSRVSRSA